MEWVSSFCHRQQANCMFPRNAIITLLRTQIVVHRKEKSSHAVGYLSLAVGYWSLAVG